MKRLRGLAFRCLRAHRGRSLALAFLAAATLLLAGVDNTPLVSLRHLLFDQYQRLHPRDRSAAPAIIVDIDEKSLLTQGQWPWPRTRMAELVGRILAGGPHAVGLDILFVETDRLGPAALARQYPGLPAGALAAIPDPDRQLAAALASGPTVLALSGVGAALPAAHPPVRSAVLTGTGDAATLPLPAYPAALGSLPVLERAATGLGLINSPADPGGSDTDRGILRRLPLLARIGETVVPTLGLEMVRIALGAENLQLEAGPRGITQVGVGDYRLPTLADGSLLLHFGPLRADRRVSAADILDGTFPADQLAGRFVVIGLTGVGLVDHVITPLGQRPPGVDIHVQFIESLLAGEALRRPWWMASGELAVLVLAGLFLIAAVPTLRPAYAASLGGGLAIVLGIGGWSAFVAGGWLFDSASIVFLLNPLFVALLGNTLVEADERRRSAERDLQASREVAARSAGELDAARRIQMGLLPDPAVIFRDESRFTLAALLEPAREVGGDYYECFPLDERHVYFGVGDVSGKGVPASLFMTVAKTLAGALSRRESDPGEALRQVEIELSRNNPEILFVTTFVAVLDADSGALACVCAGHDAPLIRRGDAVLRLEVGNAAGPPLCALGNYPFIAVRRQLEPGDLLCLFTDGVTEASDGRRFYGNERLTAALAALADGIDPATAVTAIRDEVRRFEAGQAPADDLTLLALRWNGRSSLPHQ